MSAGRAVARPPARLYDRRRRGRRAVPGGARPGGQDAVRIGLRIGAIMVAIILVATALQLWFFAWRQSGTATEALEHKAVALATLASRHVSAVLEGGGPEVKKAL